VRQGDCSASVVKQSGPTAIGGGSEPDRFSIARARSAPLAGYADAGDETVFVIVAAVRAKWQRVRDHTAQSRAEGYDSDPTSQHVFRAGHRRQDAPAALAWHFTRPARHFGRGYE
jgi:hypothetical protein